MTINISIKVALKRVEQLTVDNMNLHLSNLAFSERIADLEEQIKKSEERVAHIPAEKPENK